MSTPQTRVQLSVLHVSDLRFPGRLSRDVALEIDVERDGGHRSGLVHINGPLVSRAIPFHPDVQGQIRRGGAELIPPDSSVDADVVVIRHPVLLEHADQLPQISAQRVIVLAYNGPDRDDGTPLYEPAQVEESVRSVFGIPPIWAPRAPEIGAQLQQRLPSATINDEWLRLPDVRDETRHLGRLAVGGQTLRPTEPPSEQRRRVLFLTSNGTGMGHLIRLLAYARRLGPEFKPYFLSMSQAVSVTAEFGMPYEYLPSSAATGLSARQWNKLFAERLDEILSRLRPVAVIFDGSYPYSSIPQVRKRHPTVLWVWSRRGMWRPDLENKGRQLERQPWFDGVIEPGDLASAADRGATAQADSYRVGPVTLLDRDEALDRASARSALGLPESGPVALLTLGAGNINDISQDLGAATTALQSMDVEVCIGSGFITDRALGPGLHSVIKFPLAKYLAAFDLAVSAAGYNSFHELLRFGVPSLFIPNTATKLDDQVARADWAAAQGWCFSFPAVDSVAVRPTLEKLLTDGQQMCSQAVAADPGNGAGPGAQWLTELVRAVNR